MKNLKDIINERLVLSKNKSNQVITFEDLYIAVEKYQYNYDRKFKAVSIPTYFEVDSEIKKLSRALGMFL